MTLPGLNGIPEVTVFTHVESSSRITNESLIVDRVGIFRISQTRTTRQKFCTEMVELKIRGTTWGGTGSRKRR